MLAAILTFCGAMILTSCDIDSGSSDDGNAEENRAQIANTQWQLAEVMNQNNEWVQPDFYPGPDIPKLSFSFNVRSSVITPSA